MAASAELSVRVMWWTFLLSATTAVIGVASKNEGELLIEGARGWLRGG